MAKFPRLREGVSCSVYKVSAGDGWLSIAKKTGANLVELIRVNPTITATNPPAGSTVFLPPCNYGGEIPCD
jgi:hypothetical protein